MLSSDSPPDLAYVRDGIVFVAETRIGPGRDVAVSRDGTWIAWVGTDAGNPELYVARPGHEPVRLTFTPRNAEHAPDWSPLARRLVFERDGNVHTMSVDRAHERLLARDAHDPAWSPDGRIAYERNGRIWTVLPDGRSPARLMRGEAPAWSHDSRLAYERDGAVFARNRRVADDAHSPAWSPDGRIAFVRGDEIWAVGPKGEARLESGTQPAFVAVPRVRPVLPDLEQHAPTDFSVLKRDDHTLLGFRSAVLNAGEGPVELVASRPNGDVPVMSATQRVRLSGGGWRSYPGIGLLRFKHADNHLHWHYLGFESYELRTADGRIVIRDKKSGFCLVDRHPAPGTKPVYTDNCASHKVGALRVREGSSPGNTDIYPAYFHGQNLDVTYVRSGVYVLVHRANPRLVLYESDYTNNAASVLIELRRDKAGLDVRVLRTCPQSERCYPSAAGRSRRSVKRPSASG